MQTGRIVIQERQMTMGHLSPFSITFSMSVFSEAFFDAPSFCFLLKFDGAPAYFLRKSH